MIELKIKREAKKNQPFAANIKANKIVIAYDTDEEILKTLASAIVLQASSEKTASSRKTKTSDIVNINRFSAHAK